MADQDRESKPPPSTAAELPPLAAALASLPDAVEVVDVDGRFLFVNAAFEQLMGWRAAEVLGKTPGEVLRGGTRDPSFYEAIWNGLVDGRPWSGVLESRRKDGSLIALEISATPVRSPEGRVTHIVAIRRDITERLRAEEAVRESEARWRTVFEANPAVKLLIDPESGRIVRANEEAAAFYGWSVAELMRMRIQDINTLPEADVVAEMAAARAEKRKHFRFVHRLHAGELRRVEVFTGPLRFGSRVLLLSIIHDVTAREVAQEALVASEARLRALLAALPVGVAVRHRGQLALVNEAFAELLGRGVEELEGLDPLTLVDPEHRAALERRLEEAEAGRSSEGFARLRFARADGRSVPAEIHAIAFELDGAPSSLVVAIDASDRERLEAQLNRAHRMDALGRLAGGIAHDFNNLLFVVLGSSRLLRRELERDAEAGAGMGRHLQRVEEAAQRAVDLVRQLLLFSRGGEPTPERVDAGAAVRDVVALLSSTLGPAVHLELDLAPGCLTWMARSSFEQVVVNLVVNANDAMPEGGRLTLRTRNVDLDERMAASAIGLRPGPHVELVVADDGVGMTQDALHLAFEPFFTTKEHKKGTGLGLSVLYGLVHRARGSVSVESEPGRGATFRVVLPAAREPAAAQPPAAAIGPARVTSPPSATTVLVVDDHPAVRCVLERILVDAGYVVVGADGPGEALEVLERMEGRIDLLLTDVLMPLLSGPALAERVRARSPAVRVVYMSGHAGDALSRGAPGEGMLEKPFSAEQLLKRVEAAIAAEG